MLVERWLPVAGWEELYEISDQGRVRGPRRMLTPAVIDGYLQVRLMHTASGRDKQRKMHQLVLEAFVGPRPDGQEARHLDGVRGHCALINLVWGTKLENAADRKLHGTQCLGEGHGRAKITEADVKVIRAQRGQIRQVDLAARYGIAQSKISAIQRGELWKHVA